MATWNQPLVNGIQYNNAHLIQSFAFANGTRRSVVVFNLDRANPLQVTFAGANAPHGAVTIRQLTNASISATNENAQTVGITTQTVPSFDPAQPLTLPPFSMSVLSSDQAAAPLRLKGDLNGNGTVTAFDASIVLQSVVGAVTLDSQQQCAGDYNNSGAVSAFDAALILQCVVGGSCSSGTCN